MGKEKMKIYQPIGTEFESSLRVLLILNELKNLQLDEKQIVCIDFIAIYAADFGLLDENLHGNGLFRFSEFSAKSRLISNSLKKLVLNSAISFSTNKLGFLYFSNNTGDNIVNKINDEYSSQYRIALKEVINRFPSLDVNEMQSEIYLITLNALEDHNG